MAKFKPVGLCMNKPSQLISRKRGFHDQGILRHWEDYVGPEIAAISKPDRIKSGRHGATLVISCLSAHATELNMRYEEIMMRLNSRLGGNAITRLRFEHQHIGFDAPKAEPPIKVKPARKPPASVMDNLGKTQNEELRQALSSFTQSFYNKGV